ncbi:hypothetical protein JTB14_036517 [Gonioctena quinquepunctata]|nr:hypothetical protein JTB14_036517 [Gonioctena quinquepunctata]
MNPAGTVLTSEFSMVCRICFGRQDLKLFEEYQGLLNLFRNIVNIEIEHDSLPKNICSKCLGRLEGISGFITSAKYTDNLLRTLLIKEIEEPVAKSEETNSCEKYSRNETGAKYPLTISPNAKIQDTEHPIIKQELEDIFKENPNLLNIKNESIEIEKEENSNISNIKIEQLSNDGEFCEMRDEIYCHCEASGLSSTNGEDSCKPFFCRICSKSFSQETDLFEHFWTHETHTCEKCLKTFTHRSSLAKHMRLHFSYKPHQGKICSTFFSKNNVRKHKVVRFNRMPFGCNDCSKFFAKNSDLIIHQRRHNGEKPFECPVCHRGFTLLHNLTSHKQVLHTRKRTFQCKICGKLFSLKKTLAVHLKKHSGKRPFQCPSCPKSFTVESSLTSHLGQHESKQENKKLLKSSICSDLGRDDLLIHINIHSERNKQHPKQQKDNEQEEIAKMSKNNNCIKLTDSDLEFDILEEK